MFSDIPLEKIDFFLCKQASIVNSFLLRGWTSCLVPLLPEGILMVWIVETVSSRHNRIGINTTLKYFTLFLSFFFTYYIHSADKSAWIFFLSIYWSLTKWCFITPKQIRQYTFNIVEDLHCLWAQTMLPMPYSTKHSLLHQKQWLHCVAEDRTMHFIYSL